MAGINYGRVALGGLAGGVVANIVDFVTNNIIMKDEMDRMVQRLNLDRAALESPRVAISWIVSDFIYVFVIVWTYAAIRPRFGPGPGTAVKAGLVPYLAVASVMFGLHAMGLLTPDMFMKGSAFALVSTLLASLTGGYFYKES